MREALGVHLVCGTPTKVFETFENFGRGEDQCTAPPCSPIIGPGACHDTLLSFLITKSLPNDIKYHIII